jgi:hypothetical protein
MDKASTGTDSGIQNKKACNPKITGFFVESGRVELYSSDLYFTRSSRGL